MPKKDESKTVQVYETFIEKELDKEIIKSQRKMTAGKDSRKSVKKKPAKASPVAVKPAIPAVRQIPTSVEIPETISVKEFCEKTVLSPVKVIGELMKNGILANINQNIDFETASIIADDFGIKLKRKRSEAAVEDILSGNLEMLLKEEDVAELKTRPPIVTIMGHVDHGKTTLLDFIRETEVAKGEAGGITQHIGAYQVEKNGKAITFIDTPGHEAFTTMRARGARITDIVVLVVAADEGVKPQTIEALNHAKDAEVPIIVAITKIDKEGANVDRIKAQLAELGLQPEDWGGKTIMVPLSAITGEGVAALLEMILLVAELENLKANPNRPAVATVLEAHLDKSLGPVATIIVNTGTLHTQDPIIIGAICGRVKAMYDHHGKRLAVAGPSAPALISGLEETPNSGEAIQAVASIEEARRKAGQIALMRSGETKKTAASSLESIMSALAEGQLKTFKIVLKTDALGTLEALKSSISQIKHEEATVKIIHAAVGAITESDVLMAAAAGGACVSFNAPVSGHVREVASRNGVQIFVYDIIYRLLEDLKKLLAGLLEIETREVVLGHAEVRRVFLTQRKSMIVGCKVLDGKLENKGHIRVVRKEEKIGEGVIGSLKKVNDQVHEVAAGAECGIRFEGELKLEEGDILECWKFETPKPVLNP